MREIASDYVEFKQKRVIKCMSWWYALGDKGGYWRRNPCKKWRCDRCREVKIRNLQAQVCQAVPGPHIFVTEVNKTGRSLAQWIQRHVPKKSYYRAVKKSGGALLITRFTIPRLSIRKSKLEFLQGEFASLLRTYSSDKKRSTSRRIEHEKLEKSKIFGHFICNDVDYWRTKNMRKRIEREYGNIQNDLERGQWLMAHREDLFLSPRGNRLIEDCMKQVQHVKSPAIDDESGTDRVCASQ